MVKESNDLFYQSRERKYTLLPTLKKLQSSDVNTAHYYVQVVDYLNEMTKALMHITRPAFEHIDNNHEAIKSELSRINEARSNTKASMLYLTILTETKNMVLQSRNLLKSQQYFLKHRTGPQKWIK